MNKKLLVLLLLITISLQACVKRTDAINRGMQWVNAHVPYNASAYHNGYVQGCMGIVGYAWQFPKPGVYSGSLIPDYCHHVTKNDLIEGDILVNPGTHQLLFHSWTDSSKSHYWAIELGGSKGSIKYVIPYPYWDGYNPQKYIPCKVVKACVTLEEQSIGQNLKAQ